jgi:MFS family permease
MGMSGGLIGAYVAERNITLPFLLSTFAWAASGAAALVLMDRASPRHAPLSRAQIARDIRRKTIDSTRLGFTHRGVRPMSLAALITASVWSGWWLEWQHYFTQGFGARISVVGWIFVAMSLAQLAGAELAARASWIWERRAAFVAAMSATASAALIVSGLAGSRVWVALAAVLLAHLTSGTIGPLISAWFNELITGENRATLLSFQTSAITFGAAIGQPVQGRMVDALGVSVTWQIAGIISMSQALCYLALGRSPSDATDGAGVPGVD